MVACFFRVFSEFISSTKHWIDQILIELNWIEVQRFLFSPEKYEPGSHTEWYSICCTDFSWAPFKPYGTLFSKKQCNLFEGLALHCDHCGPAQKRSFATLFLRPSRQKITLMALILAHQILTRNFEFRMKNHSIGKCSNTVHSFSQRSGKFIIFSITEGFFNVSHFGYLSVLMEGYKIYSFKDQTMLPSHEMSELERYHTYSAFPVGKSQIFGLQNSPSFQFLSQWLVWLVRTILATDFRHFELFGISCLFEDFRYFLILSNIL